MEGIKLLTFWKMKLNRQRSKTYINSRYSFTSCRNELIKSRLNFKALICPNNQINLSFPLGKLIFTILSSLFDLYHHNLNYKLTLIQFQNTQNYWF